MIMRTSFTWSLCLTFFSVVRATPLRGSPVHYADETFLGSLTNSTYDYVIVGAGTAGLALASRLSENDTFTVAVVEAGQDINTEFINLEFSYCFW